MKDLDLEQTWKFIVCVKIINLIRTPGMLAPELWF